MQDATTPLPDVADAVRDHAQTHGWNVEHHVHTCRSRAHVEHQVTFTAGPTSIVTFWNANRDGVDLGRPDFMLYHDLDLVTRSSRLDDVIGWFTIKAAA